MAGFRFAVALAATLWATGSASAFAADAKMQVDEFDGATRVWVDPHGMDCGWAMVCASLGARWSSAEQDAAVLRVELVNTYSSITGITLNIDGQLVELQPLGDMTKFRNTGYVAGASTVRLSSKDYLVPLDLVRRLIEAKSVKARVSTDDGFVDAVMSGGKKPTKARGALERFWAKVPPRQVEATPGS